MRSRSVLAKPDFWSACTVMVGTRSRRMMMGSSNSKAKPLVTCPIGMERPAAGLKICTSLMYSGSARSASGARTMTGSNSSPSR